MEWKLKQALSLLCRPMEWKLKRHFAVIGLALLPSINNAQSLWTVDEQGREAFSLPAPAWPESLRESFQQGRGLFRQMWLVAPAYSQEIAGLGPLYNRPSCVACHLKNGRGELPEQSSEPLRTALVRLSLPGQDAHGGPRPHPIYGDQFNELGIPGVTGEGRVQILWDEHSETLADGSVVTLRRPKVQFNQLNYGPLGADILTSIRVSPTVFGMGLLDAVPDQRLLELASARKPDGVSGRVNVVYDAARAELRLGRFGWKANQPSLKQQIAAAMVGDLGITSSLFPKENCGVGLSACAKAPSARQPELDDQQLQSLTHYLAGVAVPAARDQQQPQVQLGQALFYQAGCSVCHVPELTTGEVPELPALSQQRFQPYTDLLLHDLGAGLADGRPDYLASASEWRTAPLWGIGLIPTVNGHTQLLHDGRARSVLEAILWHGGEAEVAKQRVRQMSASERAALSRFVESL